MISLLPRFSYGLVERWVCPADSSIRVERTAGWFFAVMADDDSVDVPQFECVNSRGAVVLRGDSGSNWLAYLRVVVNPMVEPQGGEMVYDWEGCLSIPDLRGLVPRHPEVRVRGLDDAGKPLDFVARGFEARIVQHEYDHLNGVVFLDRMRDQQSLAFYDEWEAYLLEADGSPESGRAE